ncbi:MAG: glutamine--tRNA ligase/YqeY domain fusion protein [Chitinophagales bacterium]|nr:glutamine--tRNA ligase/YqeY domain fusion protein [Chitinophagales bacterium]
MEGQANNFLEDIIEKHLEEGKYDSIQTRFPPEPNGYLHIGHAASICLNFGLAKKYGGKCNLRFDDTNPLAEETEYVESIQEDVKWLGFQWDQLFFTSDYFETLYGYAVDLIKKGLAYVDDLSAEEIAATKGNMEKPGVESPHRNRSIEENLQLFANMRAGKYQDGEKVLRAKIDMSHPNLLMRDPLLYRIKHAHHHRTGDKWCIYPMYDFAHGQSDSIEKVTHSICTLEFIHHRPLYDWLIDKLEIYPSHQYEFARRNLDYTVMSKRRLLQLVNEKHVSGWDDPRMPTVSGLRRRGYTPKSIRDFVASMGISKRENSVDMGLLESCLRNDLNKEALRRMAVLDPVKLIITNLPDGQNEMVSSENNPEKPETGDRKIPFGREVWIEREDFMEEPPKKYFRLGPDRVVRLKSAGIIRCTGFKKDEKGEIEEIYCELLTDEQVGEVKVKGTIHWVNVSTAKTAEIRLYDRLFTVADPAKQEGDFKEYINPDSLVTIHTAYIEPCLAEAQVGDSFQFLRKGYFCVDKDSSEKKLIFNRSVGLKDAWVNK